MSDWDYFRIFAVLVAISILTSAYAFTKQAQENKRIWEAIEEMREVQK